MLQTAGWFESIALILTPTPQVAAQRATKPCPSGRSGLHCRAPELRVSMAHAANAKKDSPVCPVGAAASRLRSGQAGIVLSHVQALSLHVRIRRSLRIPSLQAIVRYPQANSTGDRT
jgi:hypothetical protein